MCNRYLDKNREGLPKDTRLDEMKAERKKTTSLYLKKRLEDPLLLYNICWSNNEDRLEPMIAYVRTTLFSSWTKVLIAIKHLANMSQC